MKNLEPLLVRTPQQFTGESSLGFILRASEMNGYSTPRHLLSMAKATRNQMFTAGFDTTKIAKIFSRHANSFKGYREPGETNLSKVVLSGHPLTLNDIDLAKPKICVDCILENDFIPVWTDLSLVDACPRHRRMLLTVCPACRKKLSWFRPGLLRCNCGNNFKNGTDTLIAEEHAAILSQVISKLMGFTVANPCSMPVAQFETMTLRGLLGMAQSMARFDRSANKARFWSVAASAGELFSHWPENFFSTLRKVVPSGIPDKGIVKIRNHLAGTYRVILKDIAAAEDISFLRSAIVAFSSTLNTSDIPKLNDAKIVRNHSEKPVTQAKEIVRQRNPSKTRKVLKTQWGDRTFGIRDAARRIGLPVSVLQSLRRTGHFEVSHQASRAVAFHEADVLAFEAKLNAFLAHPHEKVMEGVTLKKAMNLKFKFENGKGELVAAILDGKLSSFGSPEMGIGGLLLERHEVDTFIAEARAKAFGDSITPTEVGRILYCDPLIVSELIAGGYLDGCRYEAGLRVTRASVELFDARYRSVASLAKERRTSSRYLMRKISTTDIKVLFFQRPFGKGPQPFLPIATCVYV